ncbi:hypothetical protein RF11_13399 [Thelohanellus kitauei]|uniref:Tc1-like transposase DDE domain-containing protein n=1 Tax=Thelohanellus kitauei TaxID=669202 RepID=A0A0C2MER0_THEKT|nr:hypothetical protein RF11_13399 [Thelohanellus kitauei]
MSFINKRRYQNKTIKLGQIKAEILHNLQINISKKTILNSFKKIKITIITNDIRKLNWDLFKKNSNKLSKSSFVDEIGFYFYIRRTFGGSPMSHRDHVVLPNSRGRSVRVAAAMSYNGLILIVP